MDLFKGTTICAVKRDGITAIAGDGQVTMGENVVMKNTAKKVRRIYNGEVLVGFAGTVSDAFALCEKLENNLTQYYGNLERAAVELAQIHREKIGKNHFMNLPVACWVWACWSLAAGWGCVPPTILVIRNWDAADMMGRIHRPFHSLKKFMLKKRSLME